MCQLDIRWEFNPPYASHMGGVWERLIRSVRKILGALLTQQTVTDEGLATVMVEVDSRPLTPAVLDPDGEEPLIPNHLLLMRV